MTHGLLKITAQLLVLEEGLARVTELVLRLHDLDTALLLHCPAPERSSLPRLAKLFGRAGLAERKLSCGCSLSFATAVLAVFS